MRRPKLRTLSMFLAALMLCLTVFPTASAAASATASTVQLVRTTGAVTVSNSSGRALARWDNMRLYNGYRVQTGARSYAWINLDGTKLTKLDASSRVEIRKSGSKLELLLSSGHIYFNVTSPLTSGETLNIRTSTMVTGIRGTCGWVNVIDRWTTEIYVLEGTVQCSVTDPVTGQIKTATVKSGEKAVAVAYPQEQAGDKCDILREQFEAGDISGFVLEELAEAPELRGEILEQSGLDVSDAVETAQERLEREQQEMQDALDRIEEDLAGQDSNVSTEPVWEQEKDPAPSTPSTPSRPSRPSGGTGSGTGGSTGSMDDNDDNTDDDDTGGGTTGSSITLTMPQSAEDVQEYLNQYSEVILEASSDTNENTLVVDTNMTVESGKTLTLSDGISVEVTAGFSLSVDGTMTGGDNNTLTILEGGQVTVNSSDTLKVKTIINYGVLMNNKTGKIVADTITTSGTTGNTTSGYFASAGAIEGAVTVEGGDAEITGGTVTAITQNGGSATITDGTVINGYVFNGSGGASLQMEGGTITAGGADTAALTVRGSGGSVKITGGTIDGGGGPAIDAAGSSTDIYIGAEASGDDIGSNDAVIRRDGLGPVIQYDADTGNVHYARGTASYVFTSDIGVLITTPSDDGSYYCLTDALKNAETALGSSTDGAEAGEIVMLLKDERIEYYLGMSKLGNQELGPVILDLNGHTLAVTNEFDCWADLRIRDGSDTGGGTLSISGYPFYSYSYLYLDSGTIERSGNFVLSVSGTFVMNGGEVTAYTTSTSNVNCTLSSSGGKLILNGGTITNSGEGYAIKAESGSVTLGDNIDICAKTAALFADNNGDEWWPEGYGAAYDSDDGYYHLAPLAVTASGDCGADGSNVTWEFYSNGTLSISGTGEMDNYTYGDAALPPWNDYKYEIKTVVIGDGVTNIGDFAFSQYSSLTGATIGGDVAGIGEGAFNRCENLTGVVIPDSVETIGDLAFGYCDNLESVTIGGGVTSIGDNAFGYCTSLTGVTIPEGVETIGNSAFSGCTALTGVTIPASVVSIGADAFSGCDGLTDVYYGGTQEQWDEISENAGVRSEANLHPESEGPGTYSLSDGPSGAAVSPPENDPFTDVSDTAWYNEAVRYVYERGLMNGMGGGAFSPDSSMSRGMLVTILYRLEGCPDAGRADFADVPDGQWYTGAVAWAAENGIVNGYGNGNFGPNDPMTREQMAAILYRYAAYKGYSVLSLGDAAAFPDGDKVSSYAADAVGWAVGNGLLKGFDSDMLVPAGGSTRAQAATVLMRFCEDAAYSYPLTVISAIPVMCEPSGILFLEDGSFLVTDTYNNVIWRVADGVSTVYAGGDTVSDPYDRPMGGYNDAALDKSYFNNPWAIVPFLDGYAVSDSDNNVVRLILAKTTQTVNGSTEEDLTVTELGVAFDHPTGLTWDGEGNLYVSDTFEGAVRKITPDGNVSTVIDGLTDPMGLCWKDGTLYIAETGANRIVKVTGGRLTVAAGSGEEGLVDGPAEQAAFTCPQSVAVGEDGAIYVSDTVNGTVRRIKNGVVTTVALRDESDLNVFVPTSPVGLTVYGDQLYVCDSFARKVFVISLAR